MENRLSAEDTVSQTSSSCSSNVTPRTAIAMHKDEDGCKRHADMGFHDGWGKALDQLVAHVKTL